jgi:hypothetical protein
MREIAETARLAGSDFRFALAGKELRRLVAHELQSITNLRFFLAPDSEHIAQAFRETDLYIAPVRDGSGMKTKVETLSHTLAALATELALNGYECVANSQCVFSHHDISDALPRIKELNVFFATSAYILHQEAYVALIAHYSQSIVARQFRTLTGA